MNLYASTGIPKNPRTLRDELADLRKYIKKMKRRKYMPKDKSLNHLLEMSMVQRLRELCDRFLKPSSN